MHSIGGGSWSLSSGADPDIEFCVWVLRRDGLHVKPFSLHVDGNGELQKAGLTESNWQEWFESIVRSAVNRRTRTDAHDRRGEESMVALVFGDQPAGADEVASVRRSVILRSSAARWPSDDPIREKLIAYWPEYVAYLRNRDGHEVNSAAAEFERLQAAPRLEQEMFAERSRRFWEEIQSYRPLAPIYLFTVDYEAPVVRIVPPNAAILGAVTSYEESDEYYDLVRTALKQLRASAE